MLDGQDDADACGLLNLEDASSVRDTISVCLNRSYTELLLSALDSLTASGIGDLEAFGLFLADGELVACLTRGDDGEFRPYDRLHTPQERFQLVRAAVSELQGLQHGTLAPYGGDNHGENSSSSASPGAKSIATAWRWEPGAGAADRIAVVGPAAGLVRVGVQFRSASSIMPDFCSPMSSAESTHAEQRGFLRRLRLSSPGSGTTRGGCCTPEVMWAMLEISRVIAESIGANIVFPWPLDLADTMPPSRHPELVWISG
eukprot:TRINITY_DN17060_c0_g2_i1.p1 TRINITY_DN17060_c0_g2~~TRINITY_DN17060_c0_g2_i1.p1  ORF type:complete len:277 (+),score=37.54 TRINITY_DN17060_c0_g2_i1:58-831(+)